MALLDPDRTYFMIDIPCREGVETLFLLVNDRVKRQSNDRVGDFGILFERSFET